MHGVSRTQASRTGSSLPFSELIRTLFTLARNLKMDIRFLTLMEFQRVYFYRFITLAILAAIGLVILFGAATAPVSDLLFVGGVLLLMGWRFGVECLRLKKCGPAFIHNDELVISRDANRRQIPLTNIRSVTSKHSFFMVRRYQSWSDHLAFLEFTLNTGERVYTLVESAVFERPAAKQSLAALQAAVLAAKVKNT
ncbi:hypothetical protein [Pseudomonas sp. GD03944]|uniref:hypothetical protein n=1 Tax=Pseudomonas sp. GD03944 TaxID=2975409 RepID=UPI00244BBBA2|nr:hypothetical protein [Pseudomonas sp. GD03944]MDH1261844.1 hypothetical protein [Pseudomonas sp. GD03944]